jgi:hypothetical protein
VIKDFCEKSGKRVAVLMTEHVDLINGRILFHGRQLDEATEYMPTLSRHSRILHLLLLKKCLRALFRLGDLPELLGFDNLFPGVPVYSLPYPSLASAKRVVRPNEGPEYDLVFTGALTTYRKEVLGELTRRFSVATSDVAVSRRKRDNLILRARVVINIPQTHDWKWVSSMRILAAWRCSRPVVNIGSQLCGKLSQFCVNLELGATAEMTINGVVESNEREFDAQFSNYSKYLESDADEVFPSGLFKLWMATEQ